MNASSVNSSIAAIPVWKQIFMGSGTGITNCNDLPVFSCAYAYSSNANTPGNGYIVTTLGASDNYKVQIAVSLSTGEVKTRGFTETAWSNWVNIS